MSIIVIWKVVPCVLLVPFFSVIMVVLSLIVSTDWHFEFRNASTKQDFPVSLAPQTMILRTAFLQGLIMFVRAFYSYSLLSDFNKFWSILNSSDRSISPLSPSSL